MGEEKVVALDDISLDIYRGEVVCFLGKSGSGKSTFLNMVAGLEKPTKGEIIIGSVPLQKLNEEQVTLFRQKNIGFIFQAYNLLPMLTTLENVSYPLILRGMDKKQRNKRALKAIEEVGLKGYENRKPSQMSGGQQQRVGIARAMASSAKVILFDEPTSSLDPELVGEVLNVIKKLAELHNTTMIIVTHEMKFAQNVADRVIFLEDGMVLSDGRPEDVIGNKSNERIRKFVNTITGDFKSGEEI